MTAESDDILDDLFHGCALRAYLEVRAETGRCPPGSEATRQRAYGHYEAALAAKNRRESRSAPIACREELEAEEQPGDGEA